MVATSLPDEESSPLEPEERSVSVRRRKVFYIPGYDPFHPRRYRELYRRESRDQAATSGYEVAFLPTKPGGGGPFSWSVEGTMEGATTRADFEVMTWSDIVKETMDQNIPRTYLMLARTCWTYIGSGAFFRLMKTRKGPMIAALYPIFMLTVQLLAALVLAWVSAEVSARFVVWIGQAAATALTGASAHFSGYFEPFSLLFFVAYSATFCAVAWLVLRGFRRIDNRLFAYYLMHDYSWSARRHGENPPELEARISQFSSRIRAACSGEYDEVLVVGHSSGAHIGVSVLADILRKEHDVGDGNGDGNGDDDGNENNDRNGARGDNGGTDRAAVLSFLTLGQVVPMVSFLKNAWRLRADLAFLSAQDHMPWVDVTAPGDGCAFALCDPVAVSGVAPADKRWPLVFSAAFTKSLSPARWKALRWRFFRLHFQYLCAFDAPLDYDYFRITAGAQTLWERYSDRPASKSRIETPLSRFTRIQP